MAGEFQDMFHIEVSKQGIDNRFSEDSVKFVKLVLEKLLVEIISKESILPIFNKFKSFKIKDSTCFQLPECMKEEYAGSGGGNTGASIRIQFEFDFLTGSIYDLSLHPFNEQDSTNAKDTISNIEAGDLVVRDLGYVSLENMVNIDEKGAFYVNRPNYNTLIFEKINGKYVKLDFVKIKSRMDKYGLDRITKDVYLGEKKTVKTTLIIERLPDKIVEQRILKAKKEAKKNGRQLSEVYKIRASLNLFVTNIPEDMLSSEQVRLIYRLRWQVELVFKVWKSVGQIHKVKKMKVARFETYTYAKLIWITMNWSILKEIGKQMWNDSQILLSTIKAFITLRNRKEQQWQALKTGKYAVTFFIDEIYQMSPKKHQVEKKKGSISTIDILIILCAEKIKNK